MNELYAWINFFAVPLLFLLIVATIYRPSDRWKYHEAKQIPLQEKDD